MKLQADKKRSKVSFEVGDKVFLKLEPYIQSSLAVRSNHKLAFKNFGPFTVLEKIDFVAYRLNIPDSSSVHPVFHASLVKKMVSSEHKVCPALPNSTALYQVPEAVMQTRLVRHGDTEVS
jgi:hypothetical protein